MSPKFLITAGMVIGSTIGGYLPLLWGDSAFSFTSILLTLVGGLIGVWAGYRIGQNIG